MIYNLLFGAPGCFTDGRPGTAGCLTLPPLMLSFSMFANPTLAAAYQRARGAGWAGVTVPPCMHITVYPSPDILPPCRQTHPIWCRVDIRQGDRSALAGRESDRHKRPATPVLAQYRVRLSWYARQDRPAELRLDEDRVRRLHRPPGRYSRYRRSASPLCRGAVLRMAERGGAAA